MPRRANTGFMRSRNRLNRLHLERFPGETLFDVLGRTICQAECLPRKEFFEAWEVGKRVRRRLRGGTVVDLAAGHGMLAWIMLLLDDTSPEAICVDRSQPRSFNRVGRQIVAQWPRLTDRVRYLEASLEDIEIPPDSVVVSVHACGTLSDEVITRAIVGRHRLALLPCCHDRSRCDAGGLEPWMPLDLAIDATRVARLTRAGFQVHLTTIPESITPMNRLLMAWPD